ncbi:MAG: hypothetical protein WCC64_18625, partial [Aliidongia sp.]
MLKAYVILSVIKEIKDILGTMLPDVKSASRTEAMARGLGWNSNADLRTALKMAPSERHVDDGVFDAYLGDKGFSAFPNGTLSMAVAKCAYAADVVDGEFVRHYSPRLISPLQIEPGHYMSREAAHDLNIKLNHGNPDPSLANGSAADPFARERKSFLREVLRNVPVRPRPPSAGLS